MSQREIAIQLILDEVGKGRTIDEAVQRITNRPKETQPVSDTSQEREGQMDQHQSGTCAIPECPYHERSSQIAAAEDSRQRRERESAKEVNEHDPWKAVHRIKVKHEKVVEAAKLLLAMNNCNYDRDQMRRSGGFDALWEAVKAVEPNRAKESSSEHQPAGRGGGEEWRYVETAYGAKVQVGRFTILPHWTGTADSEEIRQLMRQVAQHQALVAEREGLRESLAEILSIVDDEGHVSSYVPQVTAARKILAESALTNAANEQRSTSE